MVSLWHVQDTKSKGVVTGESVEEAKEVLFMNCLCSPWAMKDQTFQGFVNAHKAHCVSSLLSTSRLAEWYTRYTLRWNCSSLCCIFVVHVVPELKRRGITSLTVPGGCEVIVLADLEVFAVWFEPPPKKHTIDFTLSYLGSGHGHDVCEIDSCPTHNILVCRATGAIVDFSAGQFTGVMEQPHYYPSVEAMVSAGAFPGRVLNVAKSPRNQISEQLSRDAELADNPIYRRVIPDKKLSRFTRIVTKNMLRGWHVGNNGICRVCFGASSALLTCGQCKQVAYCGTACQKRHWAKEHKHSCKKPLS
ncbi:hypothetical protein ScalyP_jg6515 [Parmales sp. scaly parma]|nr:hypothetical protein ScalyP_jg6515 [Parmales sp. scaly parma]